MEDSTYQALYTGVYVFIFVIALTATIYLFMTIVDYAELSYNYGNQVVDSNIIENLPTSKEQLITGSDVITYYYNYIKGDKYLDNSTDEKYNLIIDGLPINKSYYSIKNKISYDKKYKIEYQQETNAGVATIRISGPIEETYE